MRIDFRTNNPRWGVSGLSFATLEEYVYVLGFLANSRHYQSYNGLPCSNYDKAIEIEIEGNYVDGAWSKECRIHYLNYDEGYEKGKTEGFEKGYEEAVAEYTK